MEASGIGAGGLGASRTSEEAARPPDLAEAEACTGRLGGIGTPARAPAGSSFASGPPIFGFCRWAIARSGKRSASATLEACSVAASHSSSLVRSFTVLKARSAFRDAAPQSPSSLAA